MLSVSEIHLTCECDYRLSESHEYDNIKIDILLSMGW